MNIHKAAQCENIVYNSVVTETFVPIGNNTVRQEAEHHRNVAYDGSRYRKRHSSEYYVYRFMF
jgi:hypothetical protein